MENNDLYFDRGKVWLAEMKYYSKENCGIEYSEPISYAFVVDFGEGEYANPFCVSDDLSVFERVPYANYTADGESYGTKVRLVSNVDNEGACFVLSKNAQDLGFEDSIVSSEQLINFMVKSKLYFKDRNQFIKDKLKKHPIELRRTLESDEKSFEQMVSFLAERNAHIRLIK